MTVLRSREILSSVTPKISQPIESDVFEPVTPAKDVECFNQLPNNATPSSTSVSQDCGSKVLGSLVAGEKVIVRRQSARLAMKAVTAEVVSGKSKEVENKCFNGDLCVENVDSSCVKDSTSGLQRNSGDNVRKDKIGASGVEAVGSGKRKRRLSLEMRSLELQSSVEDKMEKEILNLRSGKRIAKREMKVDGGHGDASLEEVENSGQREVFLSGDVVLGMRYEAGKRESENIGWKERRWSRQQKGIVITNHEKLIIHGSVPVNNGVQSGEGVEDPELFEFESGVKTRGRRSREEKGKMKLENDDSRLTKEDKGKMILVDEDTSSSSSEESDSDSGVKTRGRLSREDKGKMKLENNGSRLTKEEKGKMILVDEDTTSSSSDESDSDSETENIGGSIFPTMAQMAENAVLGNRERHQNIARRIAPRFARFSFEQEFGDHASHAPINIPSTEVDQAIEGWPGPFATAMKIIRDRAANKNGEQLNIHAKKTEVVELKWIPKKQDRYKFPEQLVPTLQELCLKILAKHAEAIASLDCLPDLLKHKISWRLCDTRRMDANFLELLLQGSPTEVRIRDCSWLSEELLSKLLEGCDTSKLVVLQFDLCGACLPDYVLSATLARSVNSLPSLTTVSLKCAYRLSDAGLSMLAASAPCLKSIDISQCSLITSEGICRLASSLRSGVRELYLANCCGIDAMLTLPALVELENLEVLSVAGIQTVCDDFVCELVSVHGCRMKELVLADCTELTDLSLKSVGSTCPGLCAIDLTNLRKLTDVSIGHLANGCRGIQCLKLCRTTFSDEAIAAYIDICGAYLKDLSLNSIIKVSNQTALSLARNCRSLQSLDVSWCRDLTNEALGLIADSCSSLKLLKLFGCTQVTNVFLEGHSNEQVKIIGLKADLVLKDMDVPDFLQGPLRYS